MALEEQHAHARVDGMGGCRIGAFCSLLAKKAGDELRATVALPWLRTSAWWLRPAASRHAQRRLDLKQDGVTTSQRCTWLLGIRCFWKSSKANQSCQSAPPTPGIAPTGSYSRVLRAKELPLAVKLDRPSEATYWHTRLADHGGGYDHCAAIVCGPCNIVVELVILTMR